MKTKLVIFGITGDLSKSKLLPALEQVIGTGDFDDVSIIGVSRREVELAELLDGLTGLQGCTSIYAMDLAQQADYVGLKRYLALTSNEQALVYLAVPPSAAAQIVDFLADAKLNTPNIKLLFEKPFGFDRSSAQDLIDRIARNFNEDQIYRIDHYMAKEVAAEIIRLRTSAEEHQHTWDNQSIAAVNIVASETLGVGHRATFYEQTGALRDVIQGHLLQLLSLVLMDIPDQYVMERLPDYRLAALEQLEPADPRNATRAQYNGYQDEVNNPGSTTETFVSLLLESSDPKWQNVPLRLTTGKRLSDKQTAITINYKDGSNDVFEEETMSTKRLPGAYERVLIDAIDGRKSIFTTSPEIIRAWEIIAPIQEQWSMETGNLPTYAQGVTPESLIA